MAISMNGYSTQRITGMFSGMDTQSLITNMLATDQAKIDRVFRQKEKAQWKYDAYTALNTSVSALRNDYFSVLGQKSVMNSKTYNAFKVSLTENSAVRLTSTSNATSTNFQILSASRATAAGVSFEANTTQVEARGTSGKYLQAQATSQLDDVTAETTIADMADKFGLEGNEALRFTINGDTFTFTQDKTINDIINEVNKSETANVNMTLENGKLSLKSNVIGADTKLNISNNTGTAFGEDGESGAFGISKDSVSKVSTVDITKGFSFLPGVGQAFGADSSFKINGHEFKLYENGTEKSIEAVMKEVNDANIGVTMSYNETSGSFSVRNTEERGSKAIELEGAIFGKDSVTGIEEGSIKTIENIKRSDTIYDAARRLGNEVGSELNIKINGKEFTFNTRTTTLADMMNKINGDKDANAVFTFSELTDSFQITSAETGANTKLTVEGLDVFGLESKTYDNGQDAKLKVNSNGVTREISQASNTFTLDGLTFEIIGEHTENDDAITANVERDYQPTIDAVKGFIEDYNKLIGELNTKYYEQTYRTYEPLTEEERSAITEDEAKLWDEKAKSGILRNDATIGNLLNNLRTAIYDKVGETGMSAFDLGISTVAWNSSSWRTDQGKLQLDEDKLLAALQENPSAVQEVFTRVAGSDEGTTITTENGTTAQSTGLFGRMNSFMSSFNSTMRSQNIQNTQSSINSHTERMSELLDKMAEKEERYWLQFSQLETLLSEMQSQQSWMSAQLGLGTASA